MEQGEWLAERFEENRFHLRSVAYRMLGSLAEADDAVQEAWLRLNRSDASDVDNLGGWLTTVVARICLDMLRTRKARREEPLGIRMPDPIISRDDHADPEHQALLADSVGLALLVVLDTLDPAERLAFVLHDMFAVSYDQIAPIVGRSPTAARQLASRARRRVQRTTVVPDTDLSRQRDVVNAFFAAARNGDFDALVALLAPDVVARADVGALRAAIPREVHGPSAVAEHAVFFSRMSPYLRPALVNGTAGAVVLPPGRPFAVIGFTITDGKIIEIDILADPERLRRLDLAGLDGESLG